MNYKLNEVNLLRINIKMTSAVVFFSVAVMVLCVNCVRLHAD
jgi:hypothetical protein